MLTAGWAEEAKDKYQDGQDEFLTVTLEGLLFL